MANRTRFARDLRASADDLRGRLNALAPGLAAETDPDSARTRLFVAATEQQCQGGSASPDRTFVVRRDCARAWRGMLSVRRGEQYWPALVSALQDVVRGTARPDLQPGFFADLCHLLDGLAGKEAITLFSSPDHDGEVSGRAAALVRSEELDRLWASVQGRMDRYANGLAAESVLRRQRRREEVLRVLAGDERNWSDWRWQIGHIIRDAETLGRAVALSSSEANAPAAACTAHLPFGVTPYYASLMDDEPGSGRDRAIRAQVLPPESYVEGMAALRRDRGAACDFMREHDTSPVDLVTRRYPAIAILKPFNTCPQICVYCQRNWEIEEPMAADALAPWPKIEEACAWLEAHPAIREVLITGGDPLAMEDADLHRILTRLAAIDHVDLIRIGSRVPVTLPMRITPELAALLGSFRLPGRREVALVTHVEQVYEVTPELVTAVDRLRRQGIGVYNQHVYTFFVSRRFEAANLRLLLRRAGIDPYYTFVPKGKDETAAYRVPIARILQEQKEESRLLPGSRRTDEPVYNIPGLGKNYVRAVQHRDLVSILPDGSRLYEFHPWEKNVVARPPYVARDVPILEYLQRLAALGEDPDDYASIWYYV